MTEEELMFFNKELVCSRERTKDIEESLTTYSKLKPWYIILPMYIPICNKNVPNKFYAVNINWYRNRKSIVNNSLKIKFKLMIQWQIEWKIYSWKIKITYIIYWEFKPDWMNIASIASKFMLDALKDYWCIKDDNVNIVISETWKDWWKDQINPRIEVLIEDWQ